MSRPRLTVAQQGERRRQLDALRLQRGLTPEERAEADDLANRLYMRVWAASLRQPSPARRVDPGSPDGDLSAIDIRLLLAQPIPDGDIAILHQICTERAGQIHRRGHSPQADAALDPMLLPRRARRYLNDGIEYLSLNRIDVAIPKLVKAAALIVAAIARIRLEQRDQQS